MGGIDGEGYPGTDYLVVSCEDEDLVNGGCIKWFVATMDPVTDPGTGEILERFDIGRLFLDKPTKRGIKGTRVEVGDFNMPHELTIETQQP